MGGRCVHSGEETAEPGFRKGLSPSQFLSPETPSPPTSHVRDFGDSVTPSPHPTTWNVLLPTPSNPLPIQLRGHVFPEAAQDMPRQSGHALVFVPRALLRTQWVLSGLPPTQASPGSRAETQGLVGSDILLLEQTPRRRSCCWSRDYMPECHTLSYKVLGHFPAVTLPLWTGLSSEARAARSHPGFCKSQRWGRGRGEGLPNRTPELDPHVLCFRDTPHSSPPQAFQRGRHIWWAAGKCFTATHSQCRVASLA